jgi:hypothetical protein
LKESSRLDLAMQRAPGRWGRLIRVARELRADSARDTFGRCLALSIELACAAREQKIAVNLVVWSVARDKHFFDHWAVAVDDTMVIDLTRVQIDGRTGLTYEIDDYPPNFMRPRLYPADLIVDDYLRCRSAGIDRLAPAFLWRLRWRMLKHDVANAMMFRSVVRVAHSAVSLAKFCAVGWMAALLRTFEARRDLLLSRARELDALLPPEPHGALPIGAAAALLPTPAP